MAMSLLAPAGQTVVQVSAKYRSTSTSLSAVTAETSLVVLDTSVWREGVLLVNCSAITGAGGTLTIRIYNLGQDGGRYPDGAVITRSITAVSKTRDVITVPMGTTNEITYQLAGTTPTVTFQVEAQFKSA